MSQICRVVEEAKYNAREKRTNRTKPQPWLVLKLMVFITFGIMVYAGYVYIGRFCVDIIHGTRPGVSRGSGIGLLAVFCVLYLWMLWSYFMIVITPPGFARDYISQEHPPDPLPPPFIPISYPTDFERGSGTNDRTSIGGPSYEAQSISHSTEPDYDAGIMNTIPIPLPTTTDILPDTIIPGGSLPTHHTSSSRPSGEVLSKTNRAQRQLERDLQRAESRNVARRPPTVPVLLPQHRYCTRDLFVKPLRAHHCRVCGTCVLKFDHHCPWIGQCVGARNHKFFLNFNLATSIFTSYTFSTLIAYTVRLNQQTSQSTLDTQEIVIIALSGLFFIFTIALSITHTRLICLSQTTVESVQSQTMKERESHALAEVFSFWEIANKRRVQKQWDKEWGRIDKEGNLWWLGNAKKGWEETMGTSRRTKENPWGWLSWVFPLPLMKNMQEVGLRYEVNPRFDEEGRWRRRSEWPDLLK